MSCTAAIRRVNGVAIVDLAGRFVIGDATGIIRDTVIDLLRAGDRNILMNLAHVTYLDSAAGIGGLVGGYITAIKQGAQFKLLHAGGHVDYVLRVAGLHRIFEFYDDEDTAIRSFPVSEPAAAGGH